MYCAPLATQSFTAMNERADASQDAILVDAYNALRFEFMGGLSGDIYADIRTPGFAPTQMPTVAVVAYFLSDDPQHVLLAQFLRIVIRAAESHDPVLSGMALALVAKLARSHAMLHRDEVHS